MNDEEDDDCPKWETWLNLGKKQGRTEAYDWLKQEAARVFVEGGDNAAVLLRNTANMWWQEVINRSHPPKPATQTEEGPDGS